VLITTPKADKSCRSMRRFSPSNIMNSTTHLEGYPWRASQNACFNTKVIRKMMENACSVIQKLWDLPRVWGFCALNLFNIYLWLIYCMYFFKNKTYNYYKESAPLTLNHQVRNIRTKSLSHHQKKGFSRRMFLNRGWTAMLINKEGPTQSSIAKHFLDCGTVGVD
jgi:hypothetical protein